MTPDNDNQPLRFMSVCSGIEAASVAFNPLGWEAVAFAEIDKAASAVLAHHYPDVPNLGDFTNVDTTKLGRVDVLCGGTPCQAFSIAGARASLADARGNLTLAFVGLAHELANGNGLRNVVWENVPGVLSTIDNAFGCFLGGLVGADGAFVPVERKPADGKSTRWWRWSEKDKAHAVCWPHSGMVAGPKGRAAWTIKDAQFFGLAQRRERVLVVADFGNGSDPAAVLFERVGMQGNIAPSREAGEGVAGTFKSCAGSGGWSNSVDHAAAGYMVPYAPEIARCVATREGSSQDFETTTMVAVGVAPTMRAGGNTTGGDRPYGMDVDTCDSLAIVHAIQAGALRTNPSSGPDGVGVQEGVAYTLEARSEVQAVVYSMMPQNSGKDFKARPVDVAQPLMAAGPSHGNQGGDVVCVTGTVTHTLTNEGADASEDGTGRGTPIIAFAQNQRDEVREMDVAGSLAAQPGMKQQTYVAQTVAIRGREGGGTAELGGDVATTLRASQGGGDKPHVLTSAVRRLTPRECERLQGFPDDYTRIPVRKTPKKVTRLRPEDMWEQIDGEWWLMAADGPRYKQLGNSWAVPKFRWLGGRIQSLMPRIAVATNDNNQERAIAAA